MLVVLAQTPGFKRIGSRTQLGRQGHICTGGDFDLVAVEVETNKWALLDYFRTSPAEFQAVDPEVLAQIMRS